MAKATINQQLERLEKIAADLKNEDLGLEDALKLYEEGMKLSKKCTETLEKAELKVRELTEEGEERDFDPGLDQ